MMPKMCASHLEGVTVVVVKPVTKWIFKGTNDLKNNAPKI